MNNERTKLMVDKLVEQFERGFIEDEWAENFVFDLKNKIKTGYIISPKQLNKLEDIYEKY